jgi:hypothetical protein
LQETSYEDMLKAIDALEAGAKRGELGYIDIAGIGGAGGTAAESYREMLGTVEEIDAKQKGFSAIKQAARQTHEQEERKVAEGAKATEQQARRKRAEEAEVKAVAGGMPEAKPRFGALRIKIESDKGLVLPGLQISDQVHELERIVSALRENALNEGQIKIARMEVEGLKRHVLALENELEREGKILGQLDQSLWGMRNQRLDEALALLDGYGRSG